MDYKLVLYAFVFLQGTDPGEVHPMTCHKRRRGSVGIDVLISNPDPGSVGRQAHAPASLPPVRPDIHYKGGRVGLGAV
jgi:hypothetical protein